MPDPGIRRTSNPPRPPSNSPTGFPAGNQITQSNRVDTSTLSGIEAASRQPSTEDILSKQTTKLSSLIDGGNSNITAFQNDGDSGNDYVYTGPGSSPAAGGISDPPPPKEYEYTGPGSSPATGGISDPPPEFVYTGPGSSPAAGGLDPADSVNNGPDATNPINGNTVFPVGGDIYNVGYDRAFENGDPYVDPLHNSDFSTSRTDPRHADHLAIDIFGPRGAPILSASDGEVVSIGTGGKGGNRVWIEHENPDGTKTHYYYAHLDEHQDGLQVGDTVSAGDQIGTLGDTGSARGTEPHLHFGQYENSPSYEVASSSEYAVDPLADLQTSVNVDGELAIA